MQITVYTTNTCAYCKMVKKYLDMKGYHYDVINLDERPADWKIVESLSGGTSVPVTVISRQDSPEVVRGWNLPALNKALGR